MYVVRNNKIVWAGIIWTRTWQEQAKVYNMTLQCLKSWAYSSLIEEIIPYYQTDQRNILVDLFRHMQAKPNTDIGLVLPPDFPNNILRTTSFYDYSGWSFGRAIEYMIQYDKGFDYDIESTWSPEEVPVDTLLVDDVLGHTLSDTSPVFDYPGNVKNFYYSESASRGAVSVLGFGKGDGQYMTRQKFVNPGYLDKGYPDIQAAFDDRSVSDSDTLLNHITAYGTSHRPPVITPTIQINPQMDPSFESWALGDWATVNLTSRRFPDGYELPVRIVGWELNPPQKGQDDEQLTLTLAEMQDV